MLCNGLDGWVCLVLMRARAGMVFERGEGGETNGEGLTEAMKMHTMW